MKESSSGSSGAIRGNVLRFLDHANDAFQAVGPPPPAGAYNLHDVLGSPPLHTDLTTENNMYLMPSHGSSR
jgi:hypothetical protein